MRPPIVRTLGLVLTGVLGATVLAGCGQADKSGQDSSDTRYVAGDHSNELFDRGDRKPAPDITGTTLQGKKFSLTDDRGKVVVVNFWAEWCAPCRAEARTLESLYRKYHKRPGPGVRFLGVDIKDQKSDANAFVRNYKIGYPSLYDQAGTVALAFRKSVPPNAIPSTLVIDRQGKVAGRIIGGVTYSGLDKLISKVAGT